jgi:hypothetical protein
MMDSSNRDFLWSDAWLLLAVGSAAQSEPAELASIIAMGDAIEHAIFTKEELNGGIGRLQRASYIEYTPAGLALALRGRELLDHVGREGAVVSTQLRALLEHLGAPAWSTSYSPRDAQGSEGEFVSSEEYDRAVRCYRR